MNDKGRRNYDDIMKKTVSDALTYIRNQKLER
jgi:hypothetical protein